ncbi:MAG: transglycosylase domain-containing protein, partial [Anaerolineales bacterium]|nr:transglycosylase domain-containing protein [Anaerolineales bacterium]
MTHPSTPNPEPLEEEPPAGQTESGEPAPSPVEPPPSPVEPAPSKPPPIADLHEAPTLRLPIDAQGMPVLKSRSLPLDPGAPRARLSTQRDYPVSEAVTTITPPITGTTRVGARTRQSRERAQARAGQPFNWGCLWAALRYGFIGGLLLTLAGFIVAAFAYWSVASELPADLTARASQFETARIYDAKGNLLFELNDPLAGRRTRVPLDQISPVLLAATIATEDRNFYNNPGFDPLGIVRAIWQNLQAGDTVSGASTITQQLVRALVLSPAERAERTTRRKIREIILAAEITRRYSKDEILELYLNEIYYGNLAYGVEAAARVYFNKSAGDLTLGEASLLAGLPQSPAIYDVFTVKEVVLGRQRQVLALMLGECINIGEGRAPVCTDSAQVRDALREMSERTFIPPRSTARFPHWVNYVRQLVEEQYTQALYREGLNVYTTLDPDLQLLAEQAVREHVAALAERNVTNGALVAVRPTTGEILVMVGSDDYNDPVDGQINMALVPRQPGSSIKPFTYALAFERGWTPATLIWDVPTEFPDGANPPYVPRNYDGKFHGPVTVRYALANSYNIPAVKALEFVGVRGVATGENPQATEGLIPFLQRLGVTTLTRDDYGLSLTLGGGEIPLNQMAQSYATLANSGRRVFAFAIRRITNKAGKVLCEQPLSPAELKTDPPPCQMPP